MENKKNNGLVVAFIIVLVVAIIGVGGTYYFYNKSLKDNNLEKCIDGNNTNDEKNNNENNIDVASVFYENMIKNRKVTVDYDHGIEIVLSKDGNVYYSTNRKIEGKSEQKSSYTIDDYMAGIDENGKMSNVLNGYKLNISNVVSMYHVWSGNGGYQKYIFVKGNGTIGELTYFLYSDNNKNEIFQIIDFKEEVSGYKNIVSVETSNDWDAHGYKLIDIYGNIY